jgi:hypothetical protein
LILKPNPKISSLTGGIDRETAQPKWFSHNLATDQRYHRSLFQNLTTDHRYDCLTILREVVA